MPENKLASQEIVHNTTNGATGALTFGAKYSRIDKVTFVEDSLDLK